MSSISDGHDRSGDDALSAMAEALRRSESQLREVLERSPDLAVVVVDGRIAYANPQFVAALGAASGEALRGRPILDILHPDDRLRALERLRTASSARAAVEQREMRCVRDGGGDLCLEAQWLPLTFEGKEAVLGLSRDVTAQRAAERALQESERRARTLAAQVPVGIYEADTEGRYTYVNERWSRLTGHRPEAMLGRPWSAVFQPDDVERLRTEWRASFAEGREFGAEVRLRTADGRAVWVFFSAVATSDEGGAATGYLGTLLDVTERKRAQAQLLLSDRMASVGTLASGVAHEINNPLAYVSANLDLILEEVRSLASLLPPDRVREIEELASEGRQGAEKVRRIVRALKTFARPDEEQRVRLDVHSVLDLSISMASAELRRRARVVRDYQWVPAVEADEARLGQVFINLLLNAAQALPEGPIERNTIRVVTRTNPAGRVFVEVHDSGAGIAPEHRDQIFDPFFTTRPVGRGAGLGLSICHGIVTALGGEITVASEPGQGSTFTVSLPGVQVDVIPPVVPQLPITEVRKREGRILVVDDDPMVGTTLRRVLERDHEVTVVESGREALTLVGSGLRFDVILCDVMMPQMTGIELHGELGLISADQQERMIFVTGGTFTPKARAFFDKAPNALIEKPFNLRNLRAVVREQLLLLRTGAGLDQ